MRGVFDDKELEEPRSRRDTELTLGTGSLLLLFLGLVVVCVLCFGLGYEVGHRGAPALASDQQMGAGGQSSSPDKASPSKPSATAQTSLPSLAQSTPAQGNGSQPGAASAPQSGVASTTPAVGTGGTSPAAVQQTPANQPQVRPALPAQPAAQQTASASNVQPAAPPAVPLMVQIAAVSHEEDAAVLIAALRKHGYEVSAQRDAADNLIHVRIGPFNDRNEANRWRLKLLNDGYNAMIQP